jgi:hypothetical protein
VGNTSTDDFSILGCSNPEISRPPSAELEKAGYLNERGRPYNPNSIKLMLES